MKKKPVLSLCIPTYQRPECLAASLANYEKLVSENGLRDQVEICVSDNNCDLRTKGVVDRAMRRGKLRINYRRNGKNIGYDKNIISVISMAGGEYSCLVSDEDIYGAGQLKELLGVLKAERPDSTVNVAYFKQLMPALSRLDRRLGGPDEFLRLALSPKGSELGYFIGFCWYVMKSSECKKIIPEIRREKSFFKRNIMHIPFVINAISRSSKIWVFKADYRARTDNAGRSVFSLPHDLARTYYRDYFAMLALSSKHGYLPEDKFRYFKDNFYWFVCHNLFKLRSRIPPEMLPGERKKITGYLSFIHDNYDPARSAFFRLYSSVVLSSLVPIHIVYRLFLFYMRRVRGEARSDYHEFYRSLKNAKKRDLARFYFAESD